MTANGISPRPAPRWRDPLLFVIGAVISFLSLIGQLLALMVVTGGAVIAGPILIGLIIAGQMLDRLVIRRERPQGGWPFTAITLGFTALVAFLAITSGAQV